MRHCQRILIDEPAKKIKDIYREDIGDEIAAQEVIKRGVGDRFVAAWVLRCLANPECPGSIGVLAAIMDEQARRRKYAGLLGEEVQV